MVHKTFLDFKKKQQQKNPKRNKATEKKMKRLHSAHLA